MSTFLIKSALYLLAKITEEHWRTAFEGIRWAEVHYHTSDDKRTAIVNSLVKGQGLSEWAARLLVEAVHAVAKNRRIL